MREMVVIRVISEWAMLWGVDCQQAREQVECERQEQS